MNKDENKKEDIFIVFWCVLGFIFFMFFIYMNKPNSNTNTYRVEKEHKKQDWELKECKHLFFNRHCSYCVDFNINN